MDKLTDAAAEAREKRGALGNRLLKQNRRAF
jgi:hypothetical protein